MCESPENLETTRFARIVRFAARIFPVILAISRHWDNQHSSAILLDHHRSVDRSVGWLILLPTQISTYIRTIRRENRPRQRARIDEIDKIIIASETAGREWDSERKLPCSSSSSDLLSLQQHRDTNKQEKEGEGEGERERERERENEMWKKDAEREKKKRREISSR